ncbi:MAG TPA: hypothetical protein VGM43_23670 [Bryobacteraceae bacterium]
MFPLTQLAAVFALGAALAFTASAQSISTTVTETPGNYSRGTTVTGVNGKTATLNTTASHTPGSTSRQTTVTGFNGQSSTYQNNRSWGNGSYSDTKSYTGVNGGTRTDTVSRGGGQVTNTVTGRKGNTRMFTRPARYRR